MRAKAENDAFFGRRQRKRQRPDALRRAVQKPHGFPRRDEVPAPPGDLQAAAGSGGLAHPPQHRRGNRQPLLLQQAQQQPVCDRLRQGQQALPVQGAACGGAPELLRRPGRQLLGQRPLGGKLRRHAGHGGVTIRV